MIKEAIEKILDLAPAQPLPFEGRPYTTKQIYPVLEPSPNCITVSTLTGIVDYLGSEIDDGLYSEKDLFFLAVANPRQVDLCSELHGKFKQRDCILSAKTDIAAFQFNSFMPVETFIIRLQSQFEASSDQEKILNLVSNLSDEAIVKYVDDGYSQSTTVKKGIVKDAQIIIPRIVILRPFRTFSEVIQPESRFLFRMQKTGSGPECSLFEADGGAWKTHTIIAIRDWLNDKVSIPVIA